MINNLKPSGWYIHTYTLLEIKNMIFPVLSSQVCRMTPTIKRDCLFIYLLIIVLYNGEKLRYLRRSK